MERNLIRIVFLAVILVSPSFVYAQNTTQLQKDSLRKLIPLQEGKEKLDSYNRLALLYFPDISKESIDTIMTVYNEMNAEAVKQGDITSQGMVKMNQLTALFNAGMYDDFFHQAPECLDFFAKNELWKNYYRLRVLMFNSYRSKGQIEQALDEAKAIYEYGKERNHAGGMGVALFSMSRIYTTQRRFADAEKCLRESIELLKKDSDYYTTLLDSYRGLASSLIAQSRYDDALQVAAEYEKAIRSYEKQTKSEMLMAWRNLWLVYLDIYRQSGRYDEAEIYLNKVDSLTHGSLKLYEEYAQILYGKKQYAEALEMINKEIEANPKRNQPYGVKLMILIKMGKAEPAYDLFSDIVVRLDSVHNAEANARIDELHTQYEVDKYIAEKESRKQQLIIAVGGCALLLVILLIYIIYSSRLRAKKIGLVKQIQEQDRLYKKLEDEKKELERLRQLFIETTGQQVTEDERDKLFKNLEELMENKQLYVDPELNRKSLTEALGTNEKYLRETIRKHYDMTVNEYINNLRLKYAKDLLLQPTEKYTIEAIAIDSGFGSRSTFHTLFRDRYGLTPDEFRKFATE